MIGKRQKEREYKREGESTLPRLLNKSSQLRYLEQSFRSHSADYNSKKYVYYCLLATIQSLYLNFCLKSVQLCQLRNFSLSACVRGNHLCTKNLDLWSNEVECEFYFFFSLG